MRLLRPLVRWFRCNIDCNAGRGNGAAPGAGNNLLRSPPQIPPTKNNHPKKCGADQDLLKELCSLVSSASKSEVIPSATSPSKLLHQEMNRIESSRRRREVRSTPPAGLLTHADVILDVLGGLKPGESLDEALRDQVPVSALSDELISKVMLGAPGLDSATTFFRWARASRRLLPGALAYDTMVQLLVKAGKLKEAQEVLKQAREMFSAPSSFSYGILIRALGAEGDAQGAVKLFEQGSHGRGEETLLKLLAFLIGGLCKGGRAAEASEQYEKWKSSVKLNVAVFNTLIDGLVRSKLLPRALEVFRDMEAAFLQPNSHTYQALVCGLCKSGKVDEACGIFEQMLEKTLITPHVVLYTTLIDCLCKTRRFDKACRLLEQMNSPDIVTYSALIDGLCTLGRVDYAQELLQQLLERGNLKPDVVLYNIFIKGLCKAKQLKSAMDVFRKMEGNGVAPNTITYNTVMRGLCWRDRVDDARKLFREMIGRGCKPDSGTYMIISGCFLQRSSFEEAHKLVEEIKRECETTPKISELCETGELEEAHGNLQTTPQADSGVYSSLIRRYLQKGGYLEADKLLGEMLGRGISPDHLTQKAIMSGLRALIRKKEVQQLVEGMSSEIVENHWSPNPVLFNSLVRGLSEAGYLSTAYVLVKQAPGEKISGHFWDTLILKMIRAGRTELCLEAIEQATRKLRVELHPLTRLAAIRKLSDEGLLDESVEQLREMVANDKHCTRQMAVVHSKVNTKLCNTGRVEEALELHQELLRRGLIPTKKCYNVLIEAQCSRGMLELAEKLRYEMQQVGTGASFKTLELLIDAYCTHGLLERAFEVIQEMRYFGFIPMARNYRPLIGKLCELGRGEDAFQVLRGILVLGKAPHVLAYCDVVQAFYGAGRIDEARVVFQEMIRWHNIDHDREDYPITLEQIRVMFR